MAMASNLRAMNSNSEYVNKRNAGPNHSHLQDAILPELMLRSKRMDFRLALSKAGSSDFDVCGFVGRSEMSMAHGFQNQSERSWHLESESRSLAFQDDEKELEYDWKGMVQAH